MYFSIFNCLFYLIVLYNILLISCTTDVPNTNVTIPDKLIIQSINHESSDNKTYPVNDEKMLTELNGKLMDGNPKQNIDPIKVNEGNHQENPYQLDTMMIQTSNGTHDDEKIITNKGDIVKETHNKDYEEDGNKKTIHNDAGNYMNENHKGNIKSFIGNHKTGDKHKKRRRAKGYRNKYHKDEYKKQFTYYGNRHTGGMYRNFGGGFESFNRKMNKKNGDRYQNIRVSIKDKE